MVYGITFDFTTGDGLINATQMAKAFDQDTNEFTRLASTEKFIEALIKDENRRAEERYNAELLEQQVTKIEILNPEKSRNKNSKITRDDILKTVRGRHLSGTWMHRLLALKFAAWLDVDFELWVFRVIDSFVFSELLSQQQRLHEIAVKEKRRIELEKKFGGDEEYKELQSLRAAKQHFLNAPKKAAQSQLSLLLGPPPSDLPLEGEDVVQEE